MRMWLSRRIHSDVCVSDWVRLPEAGHDESSLNEYLHLCGDHDRVVRLNDGIWQTSDGRFQFRSVEVEPVVYAIEVAQLSVK